MVFGPVRVKLDPDTYVTLITFVVDVSSASEHLYVAEEVYAGEIPVIVAVDGVPETSATSP